MASKSALTLTHRLHEDLKVLMFLWIDLKLLV